MAEPRVEARGRTGVGHRRQDWILAGIAVLVLAVCSPVLRPMRWDEFVQFALAGLPPREALDSLAQTLGDGLNHGQTGIYFVLDYLLLSVTGANVVALRLPSLLGGLVLVAACVLLLRRRGAAFGWQVLVIVAIGGHVGLAFSWSDARPYILIAASVVAMIAYYQYDLDSRRALVPRLLGVAGFLLGAVAHPYFALFLVVAVGYGVWCCGFDRGRRLTLGEAVTFANPRFVGPAAVVYVLVASVTWLRGNPTHGRDPWQYIGSGWSAAGHFAGDHLGMLGPWAKAPWWASLTLAVVVVTALAISVAGPLRRAVLPSVVLMGLGVCTSAFVSILSILRDYPVFPYQWIGGWALTVVGSVCFLAAIQASSEHVLSRCAVVIAVAMMVSSAVLTVSVRAADTPQILDYWRWSGQDPSAPPADARAWTIDEWVAYGNANIARGGPVWPSVGRYYEQWTGPARQVGEARVVQ